MSTSHIADPVNHRYDQTFYLARSSYADIGPTSSSADPSRPGAWQCMRENPNRLFTTSHAAQQQRNAWLFIFVVDTQALFYLVYAVPLFVLLAVTVVVSLNLMMIIVMMIVIMIIEDMMNTEYGGHDNDYIDDDDDDDGDDDDDDSVNNTDAHVEEKGN